MLRAKMSKNEPSLRYNMGTEWEAEHGVQGICAISFYGAWKQMMKFGLA
jgi:hypothetical protein